MHSLNGYSLGLQLPSKRHAYIQQSGLRSALSLVSSQKQSSNVFKHWTKSPTCVFGGHTQEPQAALGSYPQMGGEGGLGVGTGFGAGSGAGFGVGFSAGFGAGFQFQFH